MRWEKIWAAFWFYLSRVADADILVLAGDMGLFIGEGAGSGVLINSNGTILTNAHVVAGYGNVVYKGKVGLSLF